MMQKRSDFIVELGKTFIRSIALAVYADEPPTNTEPQGSATPEPATTPTINFEQMIAQARKEEKDKLYPRLKKVEDENKALLASVNAYLLDNAALKEQISKLSTGSKDPDPKIKQLEDEIENLKTENKTLKEATPPDEEAIRQKIEQEYEVKLYLKDKLTENAKDILSIFTSEVTGATKEEIDQAIEKAKEKTAAVKKDLGLDKNPSPTKKDPPKKVPPANPPTENQEEFDADYIRNLDPRSEEYKEFRKRVGLK